MEATHSVNNIESPQRSIALGSLGIDNDNLHEHLRQCGWLIRQGMIIRVTSRGAGRRSRGKFPSDGQTELASEELSFVLVYYSYFVINTGFSPRIKDTLHMNFR